MNRFLVLLLSGMLLGVSGMAQERDSTRDERLKAAARASVERAIEKAAESEYSMMKGLPGVGVLIEGLGKAEGVGGLFERDIQTDVELSLRTAGIKVLGEQEQFEHPAWPYFYVRVTTVIGDDGLVAYFLMVELTQTVTLWNGEKVFGARTWLDGALGTIDQSNLWRVREDVKTYTNRFANDWLKANPK